MDDAIEALGAGGNETAVNFMKQGKLLLEEKVKAFCRECYFLGRSDFAFTAYRDPKHDIIEVGVFGEKRSGLFHELLKLSSIDWYDP